MKLKNALGSFALGAALVGGAAGCVVRAQGHVGEPVGYVEVDEEPPPPREYVTEVRPGYIFIQGRWERRGGRWEWGAGHWERERVGYNYEQGRWERRGNRHVWVEGGWRGGGGGRGPEVRDHRHEEPPPGPPPGPIVRDHR